MISLSQVNKKLKKAYTVFGSLVFFVVFALFSPPHDIFAAQLEVPSQYSTIQTAINVAQVNDIVNVAAGTYNEAINFNGKEITVQGAGQGISILDGTGLNDTVVTVTSGETLNTVLDGFTIQNGFGKNFGSVSYGGGAYIENSSITMRNLILTGNGSAQTYGAAVGFWSSPSSVVENVEIVGNVGISVIDVDTSSVTFTNSVISANTTTANVSLIRLWTSGVVFDSVLIEENTAAGWRTLIEIWGNAPWVNYAFPIVIKSSIIRNNSGSPIILVNYAQLKIENTEISNNYSLSDVIYTVNWSYLDIYNSTVVENISDNDNASIIHNGNNDIYDNNTSITNSIVWGNTGRYQVFSPGSGPIQVNYSIIQDGWLDPSSVGILNVDPLFVDLLNGNFHLTSVSPAIDSGDLNSPLDLDGTRADMGAYPFFHEPAPIEQINDLIDVVVDMNLQNGIENSLDAKLESAQNALDDVNVNNDVAAINSLQALINAVEAQRGNKITNEEADVLVAAAQAIIDNLSS